MSNPVVVHSKLSFSGRERWRNCPASVGLSAGVTDVSSPAAAEGTAAHTVAEHYVRQLGPLYGLPPCNDMGEAPEQQFPAGFDPKGVTLAQWNAAMRAHGKEYRDFIVSLIPAGEQAFISLEQKVQAKSISEHLFGTADCLIWLPRLRKLIVIDYKYGFMEVEVAEFDTAGHVTRVNPQLGAYAVAALDQCTLQADGGVVLAIYQPRRTFGKPAQTVELPAQWVQEERTKLAREVDAVKTGGAPVPGDHCRYCKGKSKCPTTHNAVSAGIQTAGGLLDLRAIPKDTLIDLWASRAAFKAFWEDVEELVEQEVKNGNPKLTVKETQGRQMWADPSAAALTLMAIGRTDLLAPCAVSEALPHLPEDWQKQLIRRSQPSRTIKLVTPLAPAQIAETFAKYINKPVDKA